MKPGSIIPRSWYRKLLIEFCTPVAVPSLKLRNHGPPLAPPVMLQVMPMSLLARKSLITGPLQPVQRVDHGGADVEVDVLGGHPLRGGRRRARGPGAERGVAVVVTRHE